MTHENLLSEGLVTVKEAALFLRLSRSTLYNLMDQGKLCYVRINGSRRIPKKALSLIAKSHLINFEVMLLSGN